MVQVVKIRQFIPIKKVETMFVENGSTNYQAWHKMGWPPFQFNEQALEML